MTTIQWTNETLNPFRARNRETGGVGHFCVKVDPACARCYAEPYQVRRHNPIRYAAQDLALVDLFLDENVLLQPLRWVEKRMIFPCSMTDLFGEFYPFEWIDKFVAVAAVADWHIYQVLTKRAARMAEYFARDDLRARVAEAAEWIATLSAVPKGIRGRALVVADSIRKTGLFPLPGWWQGVSAGTQEGADERIPYLQDPPFSVRWVSAEPILEKIDLARHLSILDWGVVGGESGRLARVCRVDHIIGVVLQFRSAGKPVFVKQLGARPIEPTGEEIKLVDSKGGDPAEWPEFLRVRQMPARIAS